MPKTLIKNYKNQIKKIDSIIEAWNKIDLIDNETIEKIEIELRRCRAILKNSLSEVLNKEV
jgi:hypothetical protein